MLAAAASGGGGDRELVGRISRVAGGRTRWESGGASIAGLIPTPSPGAIELAPKRLRGKMQVCVRERLQAERASAGVGDHGQKAYVSLVPWRCRPGEGVGSNGKDADTKAGGSCAGGCSSG